ncbi:MAG: glycosyltransferase family 39 protein [Rhodanobacteraceae bacterium]|nr:MAG: glycosyltransferase family 39 protein [Rhodanobacteraceae bacterium]
MNDMRHDDSSPELAMTDAHARPNIAVRGRMPLRRFIESHRFPLVALICFGLLLGFAFQGSRPLWSTDEGRYVDGALQMLDSGNYLMPAYSPDELNFSKPPLTYWVIAASLEVLGRNTWAARTPYALAYLLTILLLYEIGKQVVPDKPWLPGLAYGCSVLPFFAANIVSTDVLLTLFEAMAMLGFVRIAFGKTEHHRSGHVLLMWTGWGLAFLTKGPPGLIPWLAIIPFLVIRDGWRGLGRLFSMAGIAAFLVIGFGWYAVVVLRYHGLLHYYLHRQIYERIFTAAQDRNPGPLGWAKVYLPVLVVGLLPWWPTVVRRARGWFPANRWKSWRNHRGMELFLLLWFGIPFIVFCAAQSRLPLYILPLFLPLSLMLAIGLRQRAGLHPARQWAGLAVWMAILLVAKAWSSYGLHDANRDNRLIAHQIGTAAGPTEYNSVVFVEATASQYAIEEHTPWGIRLYNGKPVYAIAWSSPAGATALCRAMHQSGSALLVLDPGIKSARIGSELSRCAIQGATTVGSWRRHPLMEART